jgi:uncharacterized membrane protein YfcA
MDSWGLTGLILLILFISTLTRSTFGFGDALLAMPLLALVVSVQTAAPLVALIGFTIAGIICWGSWHSIDLSVTWRLVLASFAGMPIGLLVLKSAPDGWVIGLLGIFLIAFGLYNLTRPELPVLTHPGWAYGLGFIAGILGSAYGANGPPVIIYGTFNRWSPDRFRATLQGFFLPAGVVILIGHSLGGLWTPQVLLLYGLALPVVVAAIFLGSQLNRRIPAHRFDRYIYLALIGLGVLLLV